MAKTFLKVKSDFTKGLTGAISALQAKSVAVGIPAAETDRDDGEITNAALLFINNFGSPAQNIPARPVMDIGIRNAKDAITAEFEAFGRAVFTKDVGPQAYDKYYNRIGIIASNSIKAVINSQEGIAPPSEATLANRERKGFKGTKALIETGQLRNAITYVIETKRRK